MRADLFLFGENQEGGARMLHSDVTDKVIQAFYAVYNTLGYGFLEKVYENAMRIELEKMRCEVKQQENIKVYYVSQEIGDYFADLLIDDCVIVELKAASQICKEHEAQLINYLRATSVEVGLLLNFGKQAEFKRKIYQNHLKDGKQKSLFA